MGIINFSIPKDLVLEIIKVNKIKNFIETGTYKGETSFWAAKYFKNVFTIEISEHISKKTSSGANVPKNIDFLVGNSKDILPLLVPSFKGDSFFWLDGHWCSGGGGKEEECPLLFEIDAISTLEAPVIFIDDARCFLGPLPPPHDFHHWPTIDEIIFKLKTLYPKSFVTIIDDVIVCVPPSLRTVVYNYWMTTYENRYHSKIETDLKKISKKQIIKYLFGLTKG